MYTPERTPQMTKNLHILDIKLTHLNFGSKYLSKGRVPLLRARPEFISLSY